MRPQDVLDELPTGSLSLAERSRFLTYPSERRDLLVTARQRAVTFMNDLMPPNEHAPQRGLCRCGKVFVLDRSGQVHCSDECRSAASSTASRALTFVSESGSGYDTPTPPVHGHFDPPLTSTSSDTFVSRDVTCGYCGKEIPRPEFGRPRKFCGEGCKQRNKRYRSQPTTKEQNP